MIDPEREILLDWRQGLRQPGMRCVASGGGFRDPHRAKYHRLTTKGTPIPGRPGERAILETINTPSGRWTSVEAVQRYLAKLNPEQGKPRSEDVITPARRERNVAAAERELERIGL